MLVAATTKMTQGDGSGRGSFEGLGVGSEAVGSGGRCSDLAQTLASGDVMRNAL